MRVTSVILRTAVRLILPLSLLFAIYAALKGHNAPGGCFIAGLIAAVSLCIYRMSHGSTALMKLMPVHPRWLVGSGLGLAATTAIAPLFFGAPLLQSNAWILHLGNEELHVVTAMAFDTGVLLVVIGVSVGMIQRLSEELER